MNYFNIEGKKTIVTGGSRGLGRGMAEALMNAGAEVVLFATTDKIKDIALDYNNKGFKCHGVKVDIGNETERQSAFQDAMKLLGHRIDILINAAGIQRRHKSEEFPLDDWNDVININLTAVFMLSFFGGYTVPAYAASKGGIAQLTKAFSNEWASHGINVNAIAPGYMATEMNTALINDNVRNKEILARIPAGRWGTPEDLAGVVLFLSSSASDYLNGAIIPVDGGYLGK